MKQLNKDGMKQTIEEAAEEYAENSCSLLYDKDKYSKYEIIEFTKTDFITGAKSQASKDFHTQGMYSEEEFKMAFKAGENFGRQEVLWDMDRLTQEECTHNDYDVWFEDYKKRKNEQG